MRKGKKGGEERGEREGVGRSREEKEGEREWMSLLQDFLLMKTMVFSLKLTRATFFTVWGGLSHCGTKETSTVHH